MSIKRLLMALLIAGLASGVAIFAGSADSARSAAPLSGTLTFVDYGGDLQAAETKAWITPWNKLHPQVKVVQVTTYDPSKVKAQVESGNVTWNVGDIGPSDGLDVPKSLLKIDCKIVPCSKF